MKEQRKCISLAMARETLFFPCVRAQAYEAVVRREVLCDREKWHPAIGAVRYIFLVVARNLFYDCLQINRKALCLKGVQGRGKKILP